MSTILLKPQDQVVFSDLEGGEAVLVDMNARRYYTLNETAIFVWQRLEKNTSAEEIARELADTYDVTPERAAASVQKLLAELSQRNLLTSA
ncbi:MAG: PqqD family protein [Acidobacteria bacterium]|nr:PqqD family protein [Acidobacteriota bacterium]